MMEVNDKSFLSKDEWDGNEIETDKEETALKTKSQI